MQGPAITHVSIRAPWHDNRWDGRVCNKPVDNQSCLVLRAIAENRDDAVEQRVDKLGFDGTIIDSENHDYVGQLRGLDT
jgi:hypothetical protein